jgi:hypothetical protein
MHLSHGNLDFLLPLTHLEHCTVCDLMLRRMKTLRLPNENSASRGSRRARRAAQAAQKRQLDPDESSSGAGDAGQVFCPPDHGASSVFHSAS